MYIIIIVSMGLRYLFALHTYLVLQPSVCSFFTRSIDSCKKQATYSLRQVCVNDEILKHYIWKRNQCATGQATSWHLLPVGIA